MSLAPDGKPIPTEEQTEFFMAHCAAPTLDFLEDMRHKQRIRAYKGPWTGLDLQWALERFMEEVEELRKELCYPDTYNVKPLEEINLGEARFESADCGNFLVIINNMLRLRIREQLLAGKTLDFNRSDDRPLTVEVK